MDIIVKGRHTDVNERFRRQVDGKIAKIEKLDHKVIRVDVEVSKERNPRQADRRERVELTIHSRGPVIRAEAAADDRYGALDLAVGKLESRLRRINDRRKAHHDNHSPAKPAVATTTVAAQDGVAAGRQGGEMTAEPQSAKEETAYRPAEHDENQENIVPIPMEGDGPLVVREKYHKASSMTIDQALFEMELVGHDFFLFRDTGSGRPSVVYRRRGWDYGVIRLVEE